MDAATDRILRITKEIMIKFIEMGRVSPTSFEEVFKNVHGAVREAALSTMEKPDEPEGGD